MSVRARTRAFEVNDMAWKDVLTELDALKTTLATVESATAAESVLPIADYDTVDKTLRECELRIKDLVAKAEAERELTLAEAAAKKWSAVKSQPDVETTLVRDKDGKLTSITMSSVLAGYQVTKTVATSALAVAAVSIAEDV